MPQEVEGKHCGRCATRLSLIVFHSHKARINEKVPPAACHKNESIISWLELALACSCTLVSPVRE